MKPSRLEIGEAECVSPGLLTSCRSVKERKCFLEFVVEKLEEVKVD